MGRYNQASVGIRQTSTDANAVSTIISRNYTLLFKFYIFNFFRIYESPDDEKDLEDKKANIVLKSKNWIIYS
jgi:hypothetical protein